MKKRVLKTLILLCAGVALNACNGGTAANNQSSKSNSGKSGGDAYAPPKAGYMPLYFVNNTGFPDNQVHIFIKAGLEDVNKNVQDCVMTVGADNNASCTLIKDYPGVSGASQGELSNIAKTISANNSILLSSLHTDGNGGYLLYLPKVLSGRMYLSMGQNLSIGLVKDATGTLRLVDPDGFKVDDPNYYTLYDKVEFSYNDSGMWLNPTAVDFFSLPINLQDSGSNGEFSDVGFNTSRGAIMSSIDSTLTQGGNNWNNIELKYQDTILRVMAPSKTMLTNVNPGHELPTDYLLPLVNNFWNYYSIPGHSISFDASEDAYSPAGKALNPALAAACATTPHHDDCGVYTGTVDSNGNFVFKDKYLSNADAVIIDKPTNSSYIWGGAGGEFDAPNNTVKSVIIRELSSMFEVGLLTPGANATFPAYFVANKANFYTNDTNLMSTPNVLNQTKPWYDLYSKAVHIAAAQQAIYTFAYDDALKQDGTIYEGHPENLHGARIVLEGLDLKNLPNPHGDTNTYNVTFHVGVGTTVNLINSDGSIGNLITDGQTVSNLQSPLFVQVKNRDIGTEQVHVYATSNKIEPSIIGSSVVTNGADDTMSVSFPAPTPKLNKVKVIIPNGVTVNCVVGCNGPLTNGQVIDMTTATFNFTMTGSTAQGYIQFGNGEGPDQVMPQVAPFNGIKVDDPDPINPNNVITVTFP